MGGENNTSDKDGATAAAASAAAAAAAAASASPSPTTINQVAAAATPHKIIGPVGYEDVSFYNAGATSRVFRAVETKTKRVVALKRLHKQLVRDEKALARLKREFDALRLLRHEVIVQVAEVVSWEGDPTLVMDFIEGEDLKERIARVGGRLSDAETEQVARSLFGALSMTHGSGIVHRDVKPQNVRITPAGKVFLLDFGSARLDAASQLTRTGTSVGTPEYMAPELFAGPVYDPRVDIYGVGATLYECLAGHPPQSADSLAELAHLRANVDAPPIRSVAKTPPDVPLPIAAVVDRCVARAPEDRFPSAALALWSLDHPAAERALAARRAIHPLCLSCGEAIPRESASCASCGSTHPFRYELGPCHVEIQSVENVARFLELIAIRFPERATPEELETLAERCASLSFGTQRYVSFITDQNAETIVKELREVGTRATIIREPAWWVNLLIGLAVPFYLPVKIPLGLLTASGSMLSTSQVPRPAFPRIVTAAAFAMFISFLGLATIALSDADIPLVYSTLVLLGGAFIAAGVTLGAGLVLGLRLPQLSLDRKGASPQPAENVLGEIIAASPPNAPQLKRSAAAAPAWMLAVAFLPLFIECVGLAAILEVTKPATTTAETRGHVGKEKSVTPTPPSGFRSLNPATGPATGSNDRDTAAGPAPTSNAKTSLDEQQDDAMDLRGILIALAAGGAVAGLILAMIRRRERIRRDAAALMSELDLNSFAKLAKRPHPNRSAPGLTHVLSNIRTADAFVAQALRRAADLMPLLSREQANRLAASVEALVSGDRAGANPFSLTSSAGPAEASLKSRCILEADPQQRLRFDLLAIEGQLEAQAALEWLTRIDIDAKNELEAEQHLHIEVDSHEQQPQKRQMVLPR